MKARTSGPGTLFVVATPIGNLEDITLRALRVLKEVALVAAEDTRRTGNLLRHYQIATPLISLHEHNEHHRRVELVRRMTSGESVALVSDAGTPGISDPGAELVRAARASGLRVEPIPGPSSVTAALSAAGMTAERFIFAGFPPVRSKDRKNWFGWVSQFPDVPVVCFEAPHRVARTLKELGMFLGERPIMVARELTKVHEEWLAGPAGTLAAKLSEPKGEFVLVLGPTAEPKIVQPSMSDRQIAELFGQTTENLDGTRRAAVRSTAEKLGLSTKVVYEALERHKVSGE
jgi:16S rRNA (cytidine1402-2'-O)-methyltransferase